MRWLLIASVVGMVSGQGQPGGEGQQKGLIDWISGWYPTTSTTAAPPLNDLPEKCPECHCGLPRTGTRIVGGNETEVLLLPWMAALLYNGRFYCGGTLINDLYVLTAAHCTSGFRKEKMTVRLLEHDRSKPHETKTVNRNVSAIIRHLRYNPGTYDNDIALLKLDQRVDFSTAIKRARDVNDDNDDGDEDELSKIKPAPACLPTRGLSFNDYTALVTGWGTTEEGGSTSSTLQQVYVPIISNDACRETTYKSRISENMLCAGYSEGGRDACQGDSGGPLHVLNTTTNKYMVAGIVSWGEGCARPETPGVYTRVNRYSTWLKCNTRDACYCKS